MQFNPDEMAGKAKEKVEEEVKKKAEAKMEEARKPAQPESQLNQAVKLLPDHK